MAAEKTFTKEQLDEKVAAAAKKAVTKATKEETKRCLGILKEATTAAKELEDKAIKTAVLTALKDATTKIKG